MVVVQTVVREDNSRIKHGERGGGERKVFVSSQIQQFKSKEPVLNNTFILRLKEGSKPV